MPIYRVVIERVYVGYHEAATEDEAIDAAFDEDDGGEVAGHRCEEVTEADVNLARAEVVRG